MLETSFMSRFLVSVANGTNMEAVGVVLVLFVVIPNVFCYYETTLSITVDLSVPRPVDLKIIVFAPPACGVVLDRMTR